MNQTTELQTSALTGPALAWAVGLGEGLDMFIQPGQYQNGPGVFANINGRAVRWKPEEDWSQTGPLIEKHHVQSSFNGRGFRTTSGEYWCAYVCTDFGAELFPSGSGGTSQIATCRAIVVAKVGERVAIPAELAAAGGAT